MKESEKPKNKKLNQISLWIVWTIICIGLGYAWATDSYLKRINRQEKLIKSYQTAQLEKIKPIDLSGIPVDKRKNQWLMPKN